MNRTIGFQTLSKIRQFSTSSRLLIEVQSKPKPTLRFTEQRREIGPFGWFLLSIPTATFALGTWQIQRKAWKENLIRTLHERKHARPALLPSSAEEIEELEYFPVHVRGQFLHDKEIYIGPRSLLVDGDASTKSSLISKGQNTNQGYLVVTPFQLADRNETILVNRGWVPAKSKDPKTRQNGQIQGEVDVIGVVRLHENRPNFMPKNREGSNIWYYRDLEQMSQVTGASPIFLDATTDFDSQGGPVGGQTRISLRNEHLSYIFTWYSLCGITSFMWYRQFLRRI
ncbi:surfeit locus protein [Holotrichia oblita]|uniref:Surfeit locus protein n=1 Tax=Holotrichia oblita TaxID=644536 RepID=A0ACB9TWF4_HOLOL|nr:surfeit locus protein [Holotrichia oblita]